MTTSNNQNITRILLLVVVSMITLAFVFRNNHPDRPDTRNNKPAATLAQNHAPSGAIRLPQHPRQAVHATVQQTVRPTVSTQVPVALAGNAPVKLTAYLATRQAGIIGLYDGRQTDNPADNVFTVSIDRDLQATDQVWLNYRLTGVADHSGVVCSVNDRLATGGYLAKKDTATRRQRVQLNAAWLQKGDNRIQFGLHENARYGYRVSDLAIEIEQGGDPLPLAVNAGQTLFSGKAYVHGFVRGISAKAVKISVDGKPVSVRDGEFEAIVTPGGKQESEVQAEINGKLYSKTLRFKHNNVPDEEFAFLPASPAATGIFKKGQENMLQTPHARLRVDDKSLLSTRELSLTALRHMDLPALDMGMTNVTDGNKGFRFLPHGEHFTHEGATVALKYDRTKIPDGYTENDIRTFYFDNTTRHWVALERDSVDKSLCMVVSKTTHFTDMINGVITTPESPETQGFAPTMMNDIKAADPTAKIQMIAPPTANNQGSANLSYPIEILPVTGGVNPNLAIYYNSDGGSGWLGEGWNLNLPVISVDTRWGVPRYDPKYETETYSLNGTMLATVVKDESLATNPNTNDGIVSVGRKGVMYERLVADDGLTPVQFHPVSESDFSLILRYGNSPSNYYWKITNKAGITYTYGTENSVLKGLVNAFEYNTSDNKELKSKEAIAEWHLSKIEDQYKNFCKINYTIKEDIIINNSTVKAKEIIPESITLGSDNTILQTIKFNIKAGKKQKITNSGRYGFLTCSNTLLESIEIKDKANSLIRKYKAVYGNGEFAADMLAIFELYYGSEIIPAASHSFDYHNNLGSVDNKTLFSANAETLTAPAISVDKIKDIPALGGSLSTSYGGNLYLGGGIGGKKLGIEAGYNGSRSVTNNTTKMVLADITGDGLPDKLYMDGNQLKYMKNNGNGFDNTIDAGFTGKLSATEIKNSTNGWKGVINAFNIVGLDAGMDWLKGTSETTAYLSDVNNDGLVDIVNGNVVYFNYITSNDTHSFATNSGLSPSPLINGRTIKRKGSPLKVSDNFVTTPPPSTDPATLAAYILSATPIQRSTDSILAEKRIDYENMPLQDAVRVWEAPYSGHIKIVSPVKLIGLQNETTYDGVRIAIQYKGVEYWKKKIARTDTITKDTTIYLNINAGDKIFFRLQSGNEEFCDASNDVVSWSPVITYTNREQTIDINGYNEAVYKVSEGAFVNKIGYNLLDSVETTQVILRGKFTKPMTSDDITLNIYLTNDSILYHETEKDTSILNSATGRMDTVRIKRVTEYVNPSFHPKELIESITFNASEVKDSVNLDYVINSLLGVNHYRFEIVSNTNVCWDKIKWTPEIHCRMNGVDTVIFAGVNYGSFFNVGAEPYNFNVINACETNETVKVSINLGVKQNRNSNAKFALKIINSDNNSTFRILNGDINNNTILFSSDPTFYLPDQYIRCELYINDTSNIYQSAIVRFERPYCELNPVVSNVYTSIFRKRSNQELDFGHMWRGWGQFEYNANEGRYAHPIEESKLYIPSDTALAKVQNEWGIKNMRMFTLNPEAVYKDSWTGLNGNILIDQDIMCAGRVNVNDMPVIARHNLAGGSDRVKKYITDDTDDTESTGGYNEPPAPTTAITGALYELRTAPKLSSKQSSNSWWGGASVDLGVVSPGISKSGSEGSSVITSSYMDMNGDGYPDYIIDTQIEYTNRHGGLDGEIAGYKKNTSGVAEWQSGAGTVSGQLTEVSKSTGSSFGFSGGTASSKPIKNLGYSMEFTIYSNGSAEMSTQLSTLKRSASASLGVSGSKNTSILTNSYVDVNGDGLPDRVYFEGNTVKVCLNLGYSFSAATDWGLKNITCISSNFSDGTTFSASAGVNYSVIDVFTTLLKDNNSNETKKIIEKVTKGIGISFGFNAAKTTSYTLSALRDINMDGLVDKVYKNTNGKYAFSLNKGNSFTDIVALDDVLDLFKSLSTSYSASISINFRINLFWFVYLTVGGGGNYTWGHDYILSDLLDIDGDGYADIVKADESDKTKLYVRKSKIGYTNKLKSVTNPLGGIVTVDYMRSKASFDHPGGKWVMKSVAMYDGVTDDGEATDGVTMKNEFEYGNGKYDRYEREFLGFGEVTSYNKYNENNVWKPYRKVKQLYLADNIYHKGMLTKSEVYDFTENVARMFAESSNKNYDYSVKRIAKNTEDKEGKYRLETVDLSRYNMFMNQYIVYSPLKYTKNIIHGNDSQNNWVAKTTSETYSEYNTNAGTHGEMVLYKYSDKGQLGETGGGAYNYRVEMAYLDTTDMTLFTLPKSHTVYDGTDASKVLRKIEYYWWPQFASQLKTVINHIGNNMKAITDIIYDQYGNIFRKTLPANHTGQRLWYQYEFDPVYHMYPTKITDTLGYTYELPEYDYRFGIPLKTIDINGNVMTQTVDNRGRITSVTGPNEQGTAPYTIKFEYKPQMIVKDASGSYTQMPYAITKHYDATKATGSEDEKNLETVTFVDGFGRPIQVKKESMVWNGTENKQVMIVSGRAKYDAFGRVKEAYYPVVDDMTNKLSFNTAFGDNIIPPTVTTYDVLDRVLTTRLPDNNTTSISYGIAEGKLFTRVTDANGKYQDTYSTGDGKTVKTIQYKAYDNSPESALITQFDYDGINQLVKVTDAAGETTESEYDLAGRRTQVKHPASGITKFEYDMAGNLVAKQTANMLANNGTKKIQYYYTYNRLDSIVYPDHKENNVKYVYGAANDTILTLRGRLKYLEDGSGAQEYRYGRQGEVTEVRRTMVIPNQAVATYVTKTAYDSWNRLLSMTYPDGEEVKYFYNTGGLLTRVQNNSNLYVAEVKYDKFEQRTQLTYDNGTVTNYIYNDSTRQLKNLGVLNVDIQKQLMDNTYKYDKVGNIKTIVNIGSEADAASTVSKKIGGKIKHTYEYDNLYRLKEAHGIFNEGVSGRTATYDLYMGYDNMHNITSKSQHISQTGVQFAGTLNAGYDLEYTINAANSQQIANIADANYRYEGAKLATPPAEASNKNTQEFSYDANGNLIYVHKGTRVADSTLHSTHTRRLLWDEENRLLGISDNGYVSQYWYDAAGERTVKESFDNEGVRVNGMLSGARTGTSKFTAYVSPYMVVSQGGNYTKHIYMGSQRIASKVSNSGIFPTSPVRDTLQAKYTAQTAKIKERFDSLGVKYNGVPQTGGLTSSSPSGAGDSYFYHPDHLGSSSLITNGSGDLVQHIQYVPFGEVFVEERNNTWSTPYKFNAKELDEETGLYYYGARYYDPKTSVWISVDPLANYDPINNDENYWNGEHNGGIYNPRNLNVYGYCYQNPILYTDPNGKQSMFGWSMGLNSEQTNQAVEGWSNGLNNGGYAVDFVPYVGDVKGFIEGIIGTDAQGNKLSWFDRGLSIFCLTEIRDIKTGYKVVNDVSKIRKIIKPLWGAKILDYGTTAMEHIAKGHFFNSKIAGKSKFLQSLSNPESIKKLVKEAVAKGEHAGKENNYSVIHTFEDVIGTTPNGKKTKTLQIFMDNKGNVKNAYPIATPK